MFKKPFFLLKESLGKESQLLLQLAKALGKKPFQNRFYLFSAFFSAEMPCGFFFKLLREGLV